MSMKRSLFDKNLILMELKNSYWIGIVYFIGMLCVEVMLVSDGRTKVMGHIEYKIFPLSLLFMIIGSVAVGGMLFKYLNKKNSSDFIHSFPINKRSLFFSKFITGLILLIPATTLIYGWIALGISEEIQYGIGQTSYDSLVIYLLIVLVQILSFIIGIGGTLVTSSFLVGGLLSGVFIALPYGLKRLIVSFQHAWIWGNQSSYYEAGNITGPSYHLMPLSNVKMYNLEMMYQNIGVYILFIVISIFLYTAAVYLIFIKRKEENSGKMVAFLWMKPILRIGFTLCTVLLVSLLISGAEYAGCNGWRYIFWYAVSGITAYIGSNMFIEKKIRGAITKGRVIELLCILCITCVTPVVLWMDIPNIGIREISIKKGEGLSVHVDRNFEYLNFYTTSDDEDFIEGVNELLEYLYITRNDGEEFYFGRSIGIQKIDGENWKSRAYLKFDPRVEEKFDWEKIYTSREYRMSRFREIDSQGKVDYIRLSKGVTKHYNNKSKRIVDRDAVKKIYEAVKKDREVMTYEQLISDTGLCKIEFFVNMTVDEENREMGYSFFITEEYKNTLNTLKNLGMEKDAFLVAEDVESITLIDELKETRVDITDKDKIKGLLEIYNSNVMKYPYRNYEGRSIEIRVTEEGAKDSGNGYCHVPYDEAFQFLEE